MIRKNIQLSNHTVAIEYIVPIGVKDENVLAIFLHEALGSINQWRNFPQLICDKLGINGFVYERQGHGNSSDFTSNRSANYLHESAYVELDELLKILIPQGKKVILIGHSDGASIALLYAAKFPKLVAGIVSMAAHVVNEPETIAGIIPAVEAFQAGKLSGLRKFHGDKTETLFYAWANSWLSESFRSWNIFSEIQGICCPVLAIQGKEDQYGTKLQLDLIQQAVQSLKFNSWRE